MVTLKIQESFTILRDTLSKCQIYNKWTVHEYKCLFLTFVFLQIERERERERVVYKIWVQRRNSPKVTYLIFRRGSTGESFFFHGLIDFKLFLTLAWRTWVPRVSDILLSSSPGVIGFWFCLLRILPKQLTFLLVFFADGEKGATSVLGPQPIIWLLLPSPWCPTTLGY